MLQCCKAKVVTTSTRVKKRLNMSSATVFGQKAGVTVPAENGAHPDRVLILDAGAQYGKVSFSTANLSCNLSYLNCSLHTGNRSKSA